MADNAQQFFDLPPSKEQLMSLQEILMSQGWWQIDNARWTEDESPDFYIGMYTAYRSFLSIAMPHLPEATVMLLQRISMDIACLIYKAEIRDGQG